MFPTAWDKTSAEVTISWVRPKVDSDRDHIPILPFHGIPMGVLPRVTVLDCRYGPNRHLNRYEKLQAARNESREVCIYYCSTKVYT